MTDQVYLHDWASRNYNGKIGKEALIADFNIDELDLADATILLASYTYEDYNGDAYVLFERGGELFEVHGGHCSCYGLEGQWKPEKVTLADFKAQMDRGWGARHCHSELLAVIERLKNPLATAA